MRLSWRRATRKDVPLLALLNRRLIIDERARTSPNVPFLMDRMRRWLSTRYRAVLFTLDHRPVAYAVYRKSETGTYLRQFYVDRPYRRRGVGRAAVRLLVGKILPRKGPISVDVYLHNRSGVAFWKATGFKPRVLGLERSSR